jgi:hypothetical protein
VSFFCYGLSIVILLSLLCNEKKTSKYINFNDMTEALRDLVILIKCDRHYMSIPILFLSMKQVLTDGPLSLFLEKVIVL